MLASSANRDSRGGGRRREAKPFDFRRPNKLNRDHLRNLEIVHETFAGQMSTVLSSTLRAVSTMTVTSIEQFTYDEYVRDTPNPSHLSIMSIEPLPSVGIFQLPLQLTMVMVDLLLGGQGRVTAAERPLTEIESGLVRSIIDRALSELAYAFESIAEIRPRVLHNESNPQFAQIVAPSDMTVIVMFELRIGDQAGVASLCYPYTTLGPVLETMGDKTTQLRGSHHDLGAVQELLAERLNDVAVEVCVDFAPTTLSSRDVLALQVGDVLALGQPTDATLTAAVKGIPVFQVRPARKGKRLACQIVTRETPRRSRP